MKLDSVRTKAGALVVWSTILGCSSLVAATARAAPPDASDTRSAESLYQQAKKAYDEGRFQDAIALLTQAYALTKQPAALYNLARAYENLGDLAKAIEAYQNYLVSDPNTPDRGSIEQRVETLKKELKEREEAAAAQSKLAEARQEADDAARRAEEARQDSQKRARPALSPIPWIVAGVGVAGLATGAVFGALALSTHNTAQSEVSVPGELQHANSDQQRAKDDATIANVAFVGGGIVTAVGLAWGLLDLRASSTAVGDTGSGGTRLVVGLGSIALHQTF